MHNVTFVHISTTYPFPHHSLTLLVKEDIHAPSIGPTFISVDFFLKGNSFL